MSEDISSQVIYPIIDSTPSELSHTSELKARDAMFKGTLDMQEALFEHASRYRSRLKKTAAVIDNLEDKVFDEEFINELDPRSLIKLLVLARDSEKDAIGYLERLHKLVQDSQRVIKVTQTLSMSGVSTNHSSSDSEDVDKLKLDEIRSLLMRVITDK